MGSAGEGWHPLRGTHMEQEHSDHRQAAGVKHYGLTTDPIPHPPKLLEGGNIRGWMRGSWI